MLHRIYTKTNIKKCIKILSNFIINNITKLTKIINILYQKNNYNNINIIKEKQ
jgi:hypothetical protein